jgi:Calx-beta domain/Bacterial Ig domain
MRLPMQMWKRTLIALGFSPADLRRSGGMEKRRRRSRQLGIESLEGRALLTTASLSAGTSVTEGSQVFVTVMLDEPSEDTVGVYFSTADGSATAGDDYPALSGSIWFAPGETQSSFAIGTEDDSEDENNETFAVSLTGAAGADLGSPTSATITIHDNDGPPPPPPTPTIYLSVSGSVLEGNSVQITATLNAASDEWVTLSYATTDGSADSPADYQETSGTITIAPGDTQASFVISTVDDSDNEPNETFSLVFGQPSGALLGSSSSYSITILASDTPPPPPAIHLSASGSVTEGGSVYVTLTIDPPSDQPVSVHYSTNDETATSPSDYNDTSGDISFAPYQTQASFTISTNDDSDPEPSETFSVSLDGATGADLAWPSSATITILANDGYQPPRTIYMDVGAPVTEGGQANVTLTIDPPSDQWASVHYATGDGTATSGSDYSGASGDVSFSPYQTQASFTVYAYDDSDPEPSETFSVSLNGATGADLASPSSATITILDNDGYTPTISISASGSATEGSPAQLTLTLDAPAPETISLPYSTADGDAVSPTDYEGVTNGTVTFAPGATQATITILTHEDPSSTNDKTFTVNFLPPTNALLGPVTSATITIQDSGGGSSCSAGYGTQTPPELSISAGAGSEGSNAPIIVYLHLSHYTCEEVWVDFAIQDITTTVGDDYTLQPASPDLPNYLPSGNTGGSIRFPAGSVDATFQISVVNDLKIEGAESLSIALSNEQHATLGSPSTVTAQIFDDDFPVANDDGVNDEYWTFDDQDLTVTADQGVLVNDEPYDPNAQQQEITASLVQNAEHGTVNLSPDGSFVYTPDPGFYGMDHFEYRASSNLLQSAPATVFIGVDALFIEAKARGSWDWTTIGWTVNGNGQVPFPPPSAWVGQAIDLRTKTLGPIPVLPVGTTFQWTVQGKVVAGHQDDDQSASDTPFTAELAARAEPTVFWVDKGIKTVQVDVTLPNKPPISASGNVDLKRPEADLTSETSRHVYAYSYDGGGWPAWWIRFGNPTDPAAFIKKEGIQFTIVADPAAAGVGGYKLAQLVDTTARFGYRDEFWNPVAPFKRYIKISNGFVLDTHNPSLLPDLKDSPGFNFPQGAMQGPLIRNDSFRTYLMWRPSTPGAIFVPLRVTVWSWGVVATSNDDGSAWQLPGEYPSANDPPSQDTTQFPIYDRNIVNVQIYEDL